MSLSLTTASNVMKVFYLPQVQEQLNGQSILYDRLKKNQQTVDGKNYTYAMRTGRNSSAGTGYASGGQFPVAGNQGYTGAIVPNARIATSIEVTGDVIKSTKTDAGAFIRATRSEVDGAMNDTVRRLNWIFHGDGTGALAYWTATDNSSPITVDDGQGNAFLGIDGTTTFSCDLVDASDNATLLNTGALVTSVGAEGASSFVITYTGGTQTGSADGDYLVLSGSLGNEPMGIRGVISASNPPLLSAGLQGIDVSSVNNFWKAAVFSNSGVNRDLTLELMQKPLTRIGITSGMSEADVKLLLCNGAVRDKYVALLLADKRHVNTMELDGGFTAVDFNGKPVVVDPQCRHNCIYYISPKTMDILTSSSGLQWADFADGQMWDKKPGSGAYYDAYVASLVFYGQLAVNKRNGNGLLADITE